MANERRDITGGAAPTTLVSGIGSGDTSFTISESSGWPSGTLGDFFVVIDRGNAGEEKIRCSDRTGETVNVPLAGRGADGTSASAHAAGVAVEHCATALDADEANDVVSQVLGQITTAGDTLYGTAAGTLGVRSGGTEGQFYVQGLGGPEWTTLEAANISDLIETIQDNLGNSFIVNGGNIALTYNDVDGTLSIAVSGLASTDLSDFEEATQDVIGALGWGGSGLTFAYDDSLGTATIAVNVDDATLEVNGDTLQVKAGGILEAHLATDSVTNAKIGSEAVDTAELAPGAVETATIADANVTLAKVASEAWTSWTPTIGGGWTQGTGTVSGHYVKIGRTYIVKGGFQIGNGTIGTGLTIGGLPAAPVNHTAHGDCFIYDASGTAHYQAKITVAVLSTTGTIQYSGAVGIPVLYAAVDANSPIAFAASDIFEFELTYEAAS